MLSVDGIICAVSHISCMETAEENTDEEQRQMAINLIRLSSVMTIPILVGVWFFFLDASLTVGIPIGILVVLELVMAVKAEAIFDLIQEDDEDEDDAP